MAVATTEAVDIAQEFLTLAQDRGLPAVGAILYDSHARGKGRPDSDIDLLVLVADDVSKADLHEVAVELWKLTSFVDTRIEPLAVRRVTFEQDDETPLLEVIRREGIRIAA